VVHVAASLDDAEVVGELVLLQQVAVPLHDLDRRVELGPLGQHQGGADLGDQQRAQLVGVGHEGLVELAEAMEAEGAVTRPVGRVERRAGAADGAGGVVDRGVGSGTERLARGRVDRLEGTVPLRGDQLTTDEQAFFMPHVAETIFSKFGKQVLEIR
jgi:hypothetical protein